MTQRRQQADSFEAAVKAALDERGAPKRTFVQNEATQAFILMLQAGEDVTRFASDEVRSSPNKNGGLNLWMEVDGRTFCFSCSELQ